MASRNHNFTCRCLSLIKSSPRQGRRWIGDGREGKSQNTSISRMSSNCWESRARAYIRLQGALFLLVKYRCKLELAHNEVWFNNAFDLNQDVMKIITSQRRTIRINGRMSLCLLVTIILVVRAFNAQLRSKRLQ